MCGCVAQQIGTRTRPVRLTMHSVCSRRKYKRNGMQDQHVSRPGVYEGEAKRERLVHPHMLFEVVRSTLLFRVPMEVAPVVPVATLRPISTPAALPPPPALPLLSITLRSFVCDAGAEVCGSFVINTSAATADRCGELRLRARIVCECTTIRDVETRSRPLVFDHTRIERTTCIAELAITLPDDGTCRGQSDVHFAASIPRDWPGSLAMSHLSESGDPEWVAAGERLLAQCVVATRIEARLIQVGDSLEAPGVGAALAVADCPLSVSDATTQAALFKLASAHPRLPRQVHPTARGSAPPQPKGPDAVSILTCRPTASSAGSPATLQLTLEGGCSAVAALAQWPAPVAGTDSPDLGGSVAADPVVAPAPQLVVHAHIHNPSPVDVTAFRLCVLRRIEFGGGDGGSGLPLTVEPLVIEAELNAVEDRRPERRQAASGVSRTWMLPLLLPGAEAGAGGVVGALPIPSCALGSAGFTVEHYVEVKVSV